jgi:hypothetical protein
VDARSRIFALQVWPGPPASRSSWLGRSCAHPYREIQDTMIRARRQQKDAALSLRRTVPGRPALFLLRRDPFPNQPRGWISLHLMRIGAIPVHNLCSFQSHSLRAPSFPRSVRKGRETAAVARPLPGSGQRLNWSPLAHPTSKMGWFNRARTSMTHDR